MFLVFEHRLQTNGTTCGVDLVVDDRQASLREGFLAVRRQRDHFQRVISLRFIDVGQLIFRRGEDHGDRFDLGNSHNPGLGRSIDDVADINLTQPGDAGNRRLDGGVAKLGLRVGNGGVVSRDLSGQLGDGRALSVGLLPRREFAKLGVTLQIEIGVGQITRGLRLHQGHTYIGERSRTPNQPRNRREDAEQREKAE